MTKSDFGDINIIDELTPQEVIEKIEAWEKKQEQTEKNCKNCAHHRGDDNKFKCDIKGVLCIERDRWTPKQDAPESNVDSIEVGDEVYILDKNYTSVITHIAEDGRVTFLSQSGLYGGGNTPNLHKTGRHFDIQGILDAMKKGDKNAD